MMSKADRYPISEGTHGPIWRIAKGVRVSKSVDGTYEVEVPEGGRRKRRRVSGFEKAIAAAELFALRAGLSLFANEDGQAQPPEIYNFETASKDWLSVNKGNWAPSTLERYQGLLQKHILPVIGGMPMDLPYEQSREKIKGLLADMRAMSQSPKSVEVAHAVIHGVFADAEDSGRIRQNPASGLLKRILPPKKKRNLTRPDPLTKGDRDRVLEEAWRILPRDLAMAIEVMSMTGMRIGECLAIHIDRLDTRNSQYDIFEKVRHGVFGKPKSGEDRLIDLPDNLTRKLQIHIKWLKEQRFKEGKPVDYLFPGITERIVQGAFRRACLSAKVRVRTPHDLRHTYATILLMEHYSPAYVQKQLGHSSISITVDIYGKWIPGEGKKNLDEALQSKESN